MKRIVTARRLSDAPLSEPPRNSFGQRLDRNAQPFGGDWPQAAVEIGDDAVEVNAEYKRTIAHDSIPNDLPQRHREHGEDDSICHCKFVLCHLSLAIYEMIDFK